MALVVKDRVKETTSTTGTGTLTLAGAVSGFQSFTSVLSNGDTTYYAIFESSTGQFEVGLGTFTSSGTTLARTTILESSNSGNAVNLTAGAADVFITQPAEKAVYLDGSGHIATADGRNVTNVAASTAGTVTTAAQPNITSLGTLTTLTVDDITINGSTISDAGDLTVDVGGAITLDADSSYVDFSDGGTNYGRIENSASDLKIESRVQDKDIFFVGNDGGSGIIALRLDMSDAGAATFNSTVTADAMTVQKSQITTGFDSNSFVRLKPSATTNSGGFTNIFFGTSTSDNYGIAIGGERPGTGGNPDFVVRTLSNDATGVERFRIDDSGKVGIGISSPKGLLDISGDQPDLVLTATDTSGGSGQKMGAINFYNSDPSGDGPNNAAIIEAQHAGSIGNAANLLFKTKAAGSEGADALEAVRIDSSGNVGIGTSSPTGDGTALHIHGSIVSYLHLTNSTTGSAISDGFDIVTDGSTVLLRNRESDAMRFATAGTERLRITSSGSVGIGTTSPTGILDVQDNTGSLSSTRDVTSEFFRNDGTYGPRLQVRHSTTGTDLNHTYSTNASNFTFSNGGTERIRLDSSGNLLVGATAYTGGSSTTQGGGFLSTGTVFGTRDGNEGGIFNRLTSDGAIVSFRKDGSTVGSINTRYGYLNIGEGDVGLAFRGSSDYILPWNPSTNDTRDNAIDIGDVSYRFKDIYLSSGIKNSGDLTVDVGGNINLDADGGYITFKDAGTHFGTVVNSSTNAEFRAILNVHLRPNDGTSATSNYIWNQGHVTPWVNTYFDLGNSSYGWKDLYLTDKIYHQGDTDCYMAFGTDTFNFYTAGTLAFNISSSWLTMQAPNYNYYNYFDESSQLTGTTPTINAANSGVFYLTLSGNTTFTFTDTSNDWGVGFVLYLTGNGSTVTWPNSVKWAGGSAPDAPANGETDVLVFHTRTGSTWIGALAVDAYS